MSVEPRFCIHCGSSLALQTAEEDGASRPNHEPPFIDLSSRT